MIFALKIVWDTDEFVQDNQIGIEGHFQGMDRLWRVSSFYLEKDVFFFLQSISFPLISAIEFGLISFSFLFQGG